MDNHLHPVTTRVKERWYKKVFNTTSMKIPDKFASSMTNPREEISQRVIFIKI